jgi:D-arabinose 5-phosphate isomerase GutQ
MGCHRGDGSGESGRVPNVRTTLVPFSALAAGRDFVLRVPGVAQAKLSDAELAALLNWMAEKLSDVPMTANFVLYTAAEVAAVRQQPMASVQTRRAALVAQISH